MLRSDREVWGSWVCAFARSLVLSPILGGLLLGGCASSSGAIEDGRVSATTLDSALEGRPMAYSVYTPPGWDGETPLPLVVFLHGGGDDETVLFEHAQITATFDEWIEAGVLDPFILVAPDGERGFWMNWHDGSHHYEDFVVDEVIAAMRADYPIAEGRENLHLMGISMGGAGTIYTTVHHIDRFASATVLSAPIFDTDRTMNFLNGGFMRRVPVERIFGPVGPEDRERVAASNPFEQLQSAADLHGTRLFLGVGRRDIPGLLPSNREFHRHLVEHDVPHHYAEYRGGHDWRSWSRLFPIALCLHTRAEACDLADSRFLELERDGRVEDLARGFDVARPAPSSGDESASE